MMERLESDWRSKYDYELHPKATPGFPAPVDFVERVAAALSMVLTEQFGADKGITYTVITKKMAQERGRTAAGA